MYTENLQLQSNQNTNQSKSPSEGNTILTYSMLEVIGKGTFGTVYEAKCDQTKEIVAIKSVFQDSRYNNRELDILKMLNHSNIIKMDNYFYTSKNTPNPNGNSKDSIYLNVVMSYIPMNLSQFIKSYTKTGRKVPLNEIRCISFQFMLALDYLCLKGICHRDLKPHNILIDKESLATKICDFGSAKILMKDQPNISYICSRYYRAPELIFCTTDYTNAIDMWSIGCVIAEIAIGSPIFRGETSTDQLFEIIKLLGTPTKEQITDMNPNYKKYKFPLIRSVTLKEKVSHPQYNENELSVFIDFLTKILVYEPLKRFTPKQALSHPFLSEFNSENEKRQLSRFNQRCNVDSKLETAIATEM